MGASIRSNATPTTRCASSVEITQLILYRYKVYISYIDTQKVNHEVVFLGNGLAVLPWLRIIVKNRILRRKNMLRFCQIFSQSSFWIGIPYRVFDFLVPRAQPISVQPEIFSRAHWLRVTKTRTNRPSSYSSTSTARFCYFYSAPGIWQIPTLFLGEITAIFWLIYRWTRLLGRFKHKPFNWV